MLILHFESSTFGVIKSRLARVSQYFSSNRRLSSGRVGNLAGWVGSRKMDLCTTLDQTTIHCIDMSPYIIRLVLVSSEYS